MLSKEEITRYSRNILLGEVKRKGQEKLKSSKIAVIGAGGLGSPILQYLTASGLGTIKIIDFDSLDLTNLQRQILFRTSQIGKSKAEIAKANLQELNPYVNFEVFHEKLNAHNVSQIIKEVDLVIEGSDNFPTKFLVNDYCVLNDIPFITGGILGFEGQVLGILPKKSFCYRCIFHSPPSQDAVPSCSEAGVLGSVAGLVGSFMATLGLNFLLKINCSFGKYLYTFDLKEMNFRKIAINKNPKCVLCGKDPIIQTISPNLYQENICME